MKPNNLVALLVVVILLAIGIALAVINQRASTGAPNPASENPTSANSSLISNKKAASRYS